MSCPKCQSRYEVDESIPGKKARTGKPTGKPGHCRAFYHQWEPGRRLSWARRAPFACWPAARLPLVIKWNERNRSAAAAPIEDLLWGFYACQPAPATEWDVWQTL